MIPAKQQRKNLRNKEQLRRQQNGKAWEIDLEEEIDSAPGCWARRWPSGWLGQPFDLTAMCGGIGFAIECKRIAKGNLPLSSLRTNEIENLERFRQAGGVSCIAVRRADPPQTAFILWEEVAEKALSGERGSISLGGWPQSWGDFVRRYCS